MTAQLIDAVKALQYITILANRDPDKPMPQAPESFPLPDVRQKALETRGKEKVYEPGSFGFIAKKHIAQIRKQRSA